MFPRVYAICVVLAPVAARADEPVRLRETFAPGYQYRVKVHLTGSGEMTLPPEKDKAPPETLHIVAKSAIEYDERVLDVTANDVRKTMRVYRNVEFHRTQGKMEHDNTIRPAVRRMVVMRVKNNEVPFSPDGPLTYGEIDIVRTDVFTPALAGLFPDGPVKPGDSWKATAAAVIELTDMEQIDDGSLACKFEQTATLLGRRHARVSINGAVRGVDEFGPCRHEISGHYYFDQESNHLSYITFKGGHFLLDKDGKVNGKIEGTFTLTRQAHVRPPEFTDVALRGLKFDDDEENTQLLFDNPDLGVAFLYPRRWRVGNIQAGRQLTIETENGNGLLLTLLPLKDLPNATQYAAESKAFVTQQKGKLHGAQNPKRLRDGEKSVDQFALEAELEGRRLLLDYYVIRQKDSGVTLAATLRPADAAALRPEVERIAKSLTVSK
jgi:hypothetical protein